MVEKAKKTPFKPLVKTKAQSVAEESVFKEGLPVEQEVLNSLSWGVRLVSITSIGDTVIALGDDRRLYKRVVYDKGTKAEWVTL